jgi:cell division protein FtsX
MDTALTVAVVIIIALCAIESLAAVNVSYHHEHPTVKSHFFTHGVLWAIVAMLLGYHLAIRFS